jgi:probable rRNA maturation factor
MEQLQYSNKILFYGNKSLLRGKIRPLHQLIKKIIQDHKNKLASIEVNLISDEQLLLINQQSLKHNYYTDIITFDYSEGKLITGDIYISLDRVKENAGAYKTSSVSELFRVIIHGVLHLCGYKDKSKNDKSEMTKMEDKYLSMLNTLDSKKEN